MKLRLYIICLLCTWSVQIPLLAVVNKRDNTTIQRNYTINGKTPIQEVNGFTIQATATPTATATATSTATATYTPTPSGPTLVSATVQADGHTIVLVFSVAVTSTVWTSICVQFQDSIDSAAYNAFAALPCYISGDNTTSITLDMNTSCSADLGSNVKIKYTRLLGATDVKATSGGAFLANFTDFTCVNNSGGCG